MIRGYTPTLTVLSAIVGFGISCLTYKLWYGNYKGRPEVTRPKLNNTYKYKQSKNDDEDKEYKKDELEYKEQNYNDYDENDESNINYI